MSLIRQNTANQAEDLRFFHRWVLPLSTLLPGLILGFTGGGKGWVQASLVLALGPLLAVLGMVLPSLVRFLHRLAQAVSWAMGWTISTLIILFLFYGVMLPLAVVLRLVRRQPPVALMPDSGRSTYWEPSPSSTDPESALRQF